MPSQLTSPARGRRAMIPHLLAAATAIAIFAYGTSLRAAVGPASTGTSCVAGSSCELIHEGEHSGYCLTDRPCWCYAQWTNPNNLEEESYSAYDAYDCATIWGAQPQNP